MIHPYIKRPHELVRTTPWAVPDLCRAYGWPTGLVGGGVIGIVELGGGRTPTNLTQFCRQFHVPYPTVTDVSVNGSSSTPGSDADGEVELDIQVAAASYSVATGKPADIRMYWSDDITAAIQAAATDGVDVLSISWGADEAEWGNVQLQALEMAAIKATAAGMVICAASGDNDSSDGGPGRTNVDAPASAPHIIGCGGTEKFQHAGSEIVWNDSPGNADGDGTGGGFSTYFAQQPWQAGAPHGPGRMVPDVAANADPRTGYQIILDGQEQVVGGTSAVAPLYAGLFAACGRKLGFITPKLWSNHLCFNDIIKGDNGQFRALVGPDPCTGLGSPIGTKIVKLLTSK